MVTALKQSWLCFNIVIFWSPRPARINKKQKFLVEALKQALKCFMGKWMQLTHSRHLKESHDEFCWVTLNANTTFAVVSKFWECQFPFLFISHQKYSFLLFLGSIKTLLDLFFFIISSHKSYLDIYICLCISPSFLSNLTVIPNWLFLWSTLIFVSHGNLHWSEILFMKVRSHPAHGTSRCCIVGNWTCFSFLKTFHLSSKRLL